MTLPVLQSFEKNPEKIVFTINQLSRAISFIITPVALASLPSASSAGAGARATVNNATSIVSGTIVAGGGANTVPVYSDGTNWRIG